MTKFKKQKKDSPGISTASLPDIVFMLLFFFMVTTVMREVTLQVKIVKPTATEIAKLEHKSLVSYIYVGPPIKGLLDKLGPEPRMQLNDAFAEIDEIGEFVVSEREKIDEKEVGKQTFSLKVDTEVKMGIISDIKMELREAQALKINYSTRKGEVLTK
ncbi:MAG: biopolymer transporter ExbD [Flavobacteriales bacterium]|nr:biopolymer transporter ExbD [Flavobacteriales bacterium]